MYIHIYIHIRNICVYVCISYIYLEADLCERVRIYIDIHIHEYVCMLYVCMYHTYVYVCIYIRMSFISYVYLEANLWEGANGRPVQATNHLDVCMYISACARACVRVYTHTHTHTHHTHRHTFIYLSIYFVCMYITSHL